jgi:ABC-type antimicrobial peptide transport system permease subunit
MRPYAARVAARGPSDPRALLQPLRAAIARVDPDLPIFETLTVREAAMRDKQVLAVLSRLFGIFGGGALLITAIGLYSVTAFSVAQRRREMGIRLALGATGGNLVSLLAKQVGRQLAIGLSAGLLLAYALIRGFSAAVEFNGGNQPAVLAAVVLSLLITASAATAGPALAASGTDPVKSLRE